MYFWFFKPIWVPMWLLKTFLLSKKGEETNKQNSSRRMVWEHSGGRC